MVKFAVLGYIHSTTVINIIQPIYWQGIYHYYFFSCFTELEGDPLSSCTGKTKRSGRFQERIWGQISGGVYRWPGTFHTSCHYCDNCIIVRFTILSPLSAPKGVKQWNNYFFISYWKHCKNHFTFKWTTSFNKWQQKKYAYNNGTFWRLLTILTQLGYALLSLTNALWCGCYSLGKSCWKYDLFLVPLNKNWKKNEQYF